MTETHKPSDTLELLSTNQVAKMLGVAPFTVLNWRSVGIGPPYIKLGPSTRSPVRYRMADLKEWSKGLRRIVPSVHQQARQANGGL